MHLRAVPADNGTLLGYGIIFIDLDEASEEFRSAAVESPESKAIAEIKDYAIFFLSPEGVIQTWNQGTLAIKGYTREEFVGHRFEMLFTPEDQKNGKPEEEMGGQPGFWAPGRGQIFFSFKHVFC